MHLPKIPGITPKTRRFLKLKSLWYLIRHDTEKLIPRFILRHPIRYGKRLIGSYLKKKSYHREGDFFFYGIKDVAEFQKKMEGAVLVVGFSYCHKPFACPSGRFTDGCIHDKTNPVCQQCFIGRAMHALPNERAIPLVIPTIHYIGGKILELSTQHPKLLFLITACELTLEMFGDWGHMAGVRGIGVRLDGRICNTMKAFELSERGIKPGLTVVTAPTQERMLQILAAFDKA